jgi:hypothetical protein
MFTPLSDLLGQYSQYLPSLSFAPTYPGAPGLHLQPLMSIILPCFAALHVVVVTTAIVAFQRRAEVLGQNGASLHQYEHTMVLLL